VHVSYRAWCLGFGLLAALAGCQPPATPSPTQPRPAVPVPQSDRRQSVSLLSDQPKPAGSDYNAESYRLVSRNDEIVAVLKNGLTVITKRVSSPVIAVRGYAFTGGVYEGKWLGGGLSHLLEHLVAGGSNGRRTEEQNKELLQAIGNNSNAYTTEDHTAFFVNTTVEHAQQAIDLVTGWMFTASITPDEYHREYQVVQRELEMGKGEPDRQLAYMMAFNRYRVSPARVPVIGYQAVIQGLSRDDVYSYYKLAYVPNNMMFVVAGDEDPEKLLKMVEQYSDVPPGRQFSHELQAEPTVQSPRTVVATFPKLGEARVNLAFPSVALSSPDMYAMDLLAAVLGQSESSTLVQELRDKKHLVSGISATDDTPAYVAGSFDVTLQLDPDKVQEAVAAVVDLLDQTKTHPISDDRISAAKASLRSSRIQQLQKAEDIAGSLGDDYMSTGDPHFSDLYVDRIDALTAKDLQAVAKKYFDRGKLITTALFPSEFAGAAGMPKVEDVLRLAPTTQAAGQQVASSTAIKRSVLPDGTILLTRRIPTTPLVVMQMYALGGLTAEDASTNGLGNLSMELLTRGTKTRDAAQIAEFFDSIGGEIGASCGNNTWSWSANCLTKDFDKAFEAYADVVCNPAFKADEATDMKRRIVAAIAAQDADWTAQAGRFFKKEFYGPQNSPYQFLAVGTKENVEKFTADQARDWYEKKVLTAPRVLAIFGDVDPAHVPELATKFLAAGAHHHEAPQATPISRDIIWKADGAPAIQVDAVKVQKTDQALAGVIIGFKSDSVIGDPANYTLDVIDTLTSGFTYPTGYIFETLRGLGLVYVADAQDIPGRNEKLPGTFEAYAGCDAANVDEVVRLTLENIARVEGSEKDVDMDWFKRSKELMVVADAMENETPAAQATMAALDEVMGLGYAYHEKFADGVRAVTLPQVQKLARQRLAHCIVTISTPRPELVKTAPGQRIYTSFPPVDLAPKGVQHDVGGGGK
jgi:zinc protease